MEELTMGPRPGRSWRQPTGEAQTLEPLELSTEPADGGSPVNANGDGPAELEIDVRDGHWLAGLLRADVLAVSAAGALVVAIFGLPFSQILAQVSFGFAGEPSTAWMFLPVLVTAVLVTGLGLVALRQAAREPAAAWVRITAGAAIVVGALVSAGTVVLWWYITNSGVLDPLGG